MLGKIDNKNYFPKKHFDSSVEYWMSRKRCDRRAERILKIANIKERVKQNWSRFTIELSFSSLWAWVPIYLSVIFTFFLVSIFLKIIDIYYVINNKLYIIYFIVSVLLVVGTFLAPLIYSWVFDLFSISYRYQLRMGLILKEYELNGVSSWKLNEGIELRMLFLKQLRSYFISLALILPFVINLIRSLLGDYNVVATLERITNISPMNFLCIYLISAIVYFFRISCPLSWVEHDRKRSIFYSQVVSWDQFSS